MRNTLFNFLIACLTNPASAWVLFGSYVFTNNTATAFQAGFCLQCHGRSETSCRTSPWIQSVIEDPGLLLPHQPTRTTKEFLILLSVFGLLIAAQCRGICKQGESAMLCTQNVSQPATSCKGSVPTCLTLHASVYFCLLPQDFHPHWTFKHMFTGLEAVPAGALPMQGSLERFSLPSCVRL